MTTATRLQHFGQQLLDSWLYTQIGVDQGRATRFRITRFRWNTAASVWIPERSTFHSADEARALWAARAKQGATRITQAVVERWAQDVND